MKTIKLPCYGIAIALNDNGEELTGGSITSDLLEPLTDEDGILLPNQTEIEQYNNCMNTIESIVLAHAVAGVDVESPAYLEGIETVVQAIGNNMG